MDRLLHRPGPPSTSPARTGPPPIALLGQPAGVRRPSFRGLVVRRLGRRRRQSPARGILRAFPGRRLPRRPVGGVALRAPPGKPRGTDVLLRTIPGHPDHPPPRPAGQADLRHEWIEEGEPDHERQQGDGQQPVGAGPEGPGRVDAGQPVRRLGGLRPAHPIGHVVPGIEIDVAGQAVGQAETPVGQEGHAHPVPRQDDPGRQNGQQRQADGEHRQVRAGQPVEQDGAPAHGLVGRHRPAHGFQQAHGGDPPPGCPEEGLHFVAGYPHGLRHEQAGSRPVGAPAGAVAII